MNTTTTTVDKLRKVATIELIRHDEDQSPDGQFSDERDVQWVKRSFNAGNSWAWFCAEVKVSYAGRECSDYLGGCSYRSEKDFKSKKSGGYYQDMVDTALTELALLLERDRDDLNKLLDA